MFPVSRSDGQETPAQTPDAAQSGQIGPVNWPTLRDHSTERDLQFVAVIRAVADRQFVAICGTTLGRGRQRSCEVL